MGSSEWRGCPMFLLLIGVGVAAYVFGWDFSLHMSPYTAFVVGMFFGAMVAKEVGA